MGELLEKFIGKKGEGAQPPGWFRRDNLLILILLGILLFVITLPVKKEEDPAASSASVTGQGDSLFQTTGGSETTEALQAQTRDVAVTDTEEYAIYLEEKLKKMLESVKGLGSVEVMITLESSEEKIVEKDMTAERSNTEEQDSAGGTRTVNSSNTGYQTVYGENDQGTPFVVKTIAPRVEGVLVVAEGAGNGSMASEITQIAQALFGVEAHKVMVLEK